MESLARREKPEVRINSRNYYMALGCKEPPKNFFAARASYMKTMKELQNRRGDSRTKAMQELVQEAWDFAIEHERELWPMAAAKSRAIVEARGRGQKVEGAPEEGNVAKMAKLRAERELRKLSRVNEPRSAKDIAARFMKVADARYYAGYKLRFTETAQREMDDGLNDHGPAGERYLTIARLIPNIKSRSSAHIMVKTGTYRYDNKAYDEFGISTKEHWPRAYFIVLDSAKMIMITKVERDPPR